MSRIIEAVRCQIASAFAPGDPDPARMVEWKMLATVSYDGDGGYETHPGLSRASGKAKNWSWSATTGGMNVTSDTTRHMNSEMRTRDIPGLIALGPCSGSATAVGLGLEQWVRDAKAGQPGPNSGATAGKVTFKNTFKVAVVAGGGFTLAFSEYKLSVEGNKADASNTYTIDVRFGPQTGDQAPFLGVVGSEVFGLNSEGEFDDFSDLRADRDKEEEEEDTIIKVPPGTPIVIGP